MKITHTHTQHIRKEGRGKGQCWTGTNRVGEKSLWADLRYQDVVGDTHEEERVGRCWMSTNRMGEKV
eukprot:273120-Rhodomonas_salina.1